MGKKSKRPGRHNNNKRQQEERRQRKARSNHHHQEPPRQQPPPPPPPAPARSESTQPPTIRETTTVPPGRTQHTFTMEDGSPIPGSATNIPIPLVMGMGGNEEFLLTCDIGIRPSSSSSSSDGGGGNGVSSSSAAADLFIKYDDAVAVAAVSPTGKVAVYIIEDPDEPRIQLVPHTMDGTIPKEWKDSLFANHERGSRSTRIKIPTIKTAGAPHPPATAIQSPPAVAGVSLSFRRTNSGSSLGSMVSVPSGSMAHGTIDPNSDMVVRDELGNVIGVIKSEDMVAASAASPTGNITITLTEEGTLQIGPDPGTPTATATATATTTNTAGKSENLTIRKAVGVVVSAVPAEDGNEDDGIGSMPDEESCPSTRAKADRLIKRFHELQLLSNNDNDNNRNRSIGLLRVALLQEYGMTLATNIMYFPSPDELSGVVDPDELSGAVCSAAMIIPKEDSNFLKSIIKTPNEISWTKVIATYLWSYAALLSSAWPYEESALALEEGIAIGQSASPEEKNWCFPDDTGSHKTIGQVASAMRIQLDDLRSEMITVLREDGTTMSEPLSLVGGYQCDSCGTTASPDESSNNDDVEVRAACASAAATSKAILGCCGRCRLTFYCSRQCQKNDRQNHKNVCRKRGEFRPGDWVAVAPGCLEERKSLLKDGFVQGGFMMQVQLVSPVTAAASAEGESKEEEEKAKVVGKHDFWMVSDGRSKTKLLLTKCFKPIRPALWGIPISITRMQPFDGDSSLGLQG